MNASKTRCSPDSTNTPLTIKVASPSPPKFRSELGDGMFITRGLDKCLAIYAASAFTQLAAKVGALPISNPDARNLRRIFFSDAAEAELDKQGRIVIPPRLREYGGIADGDEATDVVIVGNNDYIEIWNSARWREVQETIDTDPNAIAQQLSSYL